jgi:hypothetical protein
MWWFSTKSESTEEISEKELKNLVSSSASKVKQFIIDHPEVVYKGIPLIMVIYLFYPVLLAGWYYLPWIWATYQVYQTIPPGAIPITTEMIRCMVSYQGGQPAIPWFR